MSPDTGFLPTHKLQPHSPSCSIFLHRYNGGVYYLKPDRGIVLTYKRSDSLSTIPDDLKTLTCQSDDKNDALRYLSLCPRYMESFPDTSLLYTTAMSTTPCISAAVTITESTAPLCQDTNHSWIRHPALTLSSASETLSSPFSTWFDSWFHIRLDSIVVSV